MFVGTAECVWCGCKVLLTGTDLRVDKAINTSFLVPKFNYNLNNISYKDYPFGRLSYHRRSYRYRDLNELSSRF